MMAIVIARKIRFDLTTGVTITEEEVPKWQYQREKYPRLDVTRDVQLFGSLKRLH
jgi:hypothetical protein